MTRPPLPARFISFEGGEGAGKSTQAGRLTDWLRGRGITVVETREPGGSEGAEAIRLLLLAGSEQRWSLRTEALLFAAARSDHVERTIRPALARGEWVVCDRFVDSSLAYQGGAGAIGVDAVRALHDFGSAGLLPDRTLLLTADPGERERRCNSRDGGPADRIAARDAAYHSAVDASFGLLAAADAVRFRRVDALGPEEEVAARVVAAIQDLA